MAMFAQSARVDINKLFLSVLTEPLYMRARLNMTAVIKTTTTTEHFGQIC
jgi:hypothetical protein